MNFWGMGAVGLLVLVIVPILIFLLIRNFWLWYLKLNLIEAHLARIAAPAGGACENCKRPVDESFVACPYCETIFTRCRECSRPLRADFKLCPHCGSKKEKNAP
jgi:RNA polymerase subunit RPABC4/transcription elongation factor Spt4